MHSYADNSQQEGFTPNRIALKGMTPELEGRTREEPCSEGDGGFRVWGLEFRGCRVDGCPGNTETRFIMGRVLFVNSLTP